MYVSDMCNICKKNSDQMLMLSCVHDPCINCAASTFAEQVHVKGQSSDVQSTLSRSTYAKFVAKKRNSILVQSHN